MLKSILLLAGLSLYVIWLVTFLVWFIVADVRFIRSVDEFEENRKHGGPYKI